MSFLKKLIMLLSGSGSHKQGYKHYSSSDYYKHRHPKHGHHGHNHYGHNHYRKKHSSLSFFSS